MLEAEAVHEDRHAHNELKVHVVARKRHGLVPLVVASREELKDQVQADRKEQGETDKLRRRYYASRLL